MKDALKTLGEEIKVSAIEALHNAPLNVGTAAGTVGAGMATWFSWIPADIGKVAALVGLFFSGTLIVYRILLIRRECLEQKILKEEYLQKLRVGLESVIIHSGKH